MRRNNGLVSIFDLYLLEDYLGDEYACFTEEGCCAIDEMRDLEGITLDHTYTGKALAGGLDWLKRKGEQDKVVLFWNTFNSAPFAQSTSYEGLPKQIMQKITQGIG